MDIRRDALVKKRCEEEAKKKLKEEQEKDRKRRMSIERKTTAQKAAAAKRIQQLKRTKSAEMKKSDVERFKMLKVADLKAFITARGGKTTGMYEKIDLVNEAIRVKDEKKVGGAKSEAMIGGLLFVV